VAKAERRNDVKIKWSSSVGARRALVHGERWCTESGPGVAGGLGSTCR